MDVLKYRSFYEPGFGLLKVYRLGVFGGIKANFGVGNSWLEQANDFDCVEVNINRD